VLLSDPSRRALENDPGVLPDVVEDERIRLIEKLDDRWPVADFCDAATHITVALLAGVLVWRVSVLANMDWMLIPSSLAHDLPGSIAFVVFMAAVGASAGFAVERLRRGPLPSWDAKPLTDERTANEQRDLFMKGQAP